MENDLRRKMDLVTGIYRHEIRVEMLHEVAMAAHEDAETWILLWADRESAEVEAMQEELSAIIWDGSS